MTETKILSDTPEGAVKDMIDLTQKLLDLMEKEANDLAMNDPVSFVNVQKEKEAIATKYEAASKEFQERMQEFRNADATLMEKFQDVQEKLKIRAQRNVEVLQEIQKRQAGVIQEATRVQNADEE